MMQIHEIVSWEDPFYDAFLDLYQGAFPPNEQWPVSVHNRVLRDRMRGETSAGHLITAIENDELLGMARYDEYILQNTVVLWYFAVISERRGQGIGSHFFTELLDRIATTLPYTRWLIFEVEDPNSFVDAEAKRLCVRRIEFYQRLGARTLHGIEYFQAVEGYPPSPMCLMACNLNAQNRGADEAQQVFERALKIFPLKPRQTGNLYLG